MDISELRTYIKTNYKTRGEMYDSNKKYKSAISANGTSIRIKYSAC
jgi:hypothetical protein